MSGRKGFLCLIYLTWVLATHAVMAAANSHEIEFVIPSSVDSRISQADDVNVVVAKGVADSGVPLVVFLPGTGGRPEELLPLLQVIAQQGYRAIGLSYNDQPSVSDICRRDLDPECSAVVRQTRTFGDGDSKIKQPAYESISSRLAGLIIHLAQRFPGEGWENYVDRQGRILWNRVVIAGHSQGAGMAAYIAKKVSVRRVVLFSGPWDTSYSNDRIAPWLFAPSETPPQRWWAERHTREMTSGLLTVAYKALQIPPDHILLFDRPGAPETKYKMNVPHIETVHDAGYELQWRELFGKYGEQDSGWR